ncbi:hypothetical protein BK133_24095 [Paenibacillus sp. FSL H8-0548]|uniref:hypothetical protein n=1 Tax=Paenibacillus sp. FSL H8-0548 TaxID=1920422 RepID=UPI00096EA816|nr:hypothetical protein [Paenibacillus sp. FSL H8-0548]OMF23476.1 hypothetical protein BK133_24095 [Paenibacillus sp. FSL H8-0548]
MKKPFYMQMWLWLVIVCFGTGFIMSRTTSTTSTDAAPLYLLTLLTLVSITIFMNIKMNRRRLDKSMGIHARVKGTHIYGLPVQNGTLVELTVENGFVMFKAPNFSAKIDRHKIRVASAMTQSDFAKQEKSVIGRAVVGGLLVGPMGAVVGGMSGIGTKDKKGGFLVINYKNEVGELAAVVVNVFVISSAMQVAQQINRTANVGTINL